jgi:hypothetical protein
MDISLLLMFVALPMILNSLERFMGFLNPSDSKPDEPSETPAATSTYTIDFSDPAQVEAATQYQKQQQDAYALQAERDAAIAQERAESADTIPLLIGGALTGAAAGAAIGSLIPIPGVGTAVGAGIGAGVGAIGGLLVDFLNL